MCSKKKYSYLLFLIILFSFSACKGKGENDFVKGKEYFDQHKNLLALAWFTRALEKNPHYSQAHFYTAELLEQNLVSKPVARDHYLQVLKNLKADTPEKKEMMKRALLRSIQLSFENKEFEKTKELVDKGIEKNQEFPPMYFWAAKASLGMEDKQAAREYAETGLKKFPDNISLHLVLGDIVNQEYKQYYLGLKHYQKAETEAEKSGKENLQILLRLAFGYNLIGKYVKATHYLDRVLQVAGTDNKKYLHYQRLLASRRWRTL